MGGDIFFGVSLERKLKVEEIEDICDRCIREWVREEGVILLRVGIWFRGGVLVSECKVLGFNLVLN